MKSETKPRGIIIAEKHQSIETMRAYKKSLIYEYVTGKKVER